MCFVAIAAVLYSMFVLAISTIVVLSTS